MVYINWNFYSSLDVLLIKAFLSINNKGSDFINHYPNMELKKGYCSSLLFKSTAGSANVNGFILLGDRDIDSYNDFDCKNRPIGLKNT